MIGVALDESADDVRPHAEGITFPVLVDRDHLLAEIYAITNVPTVNWIDEEGLIVRPNTEAFGTDTFAEFTGSPSGPHKRDVKAWVYEEFASMPRELLKGFLGDLKPAQIEARLEYRMAVHLRRLGDVERARAHFERAAELAPLDFTIRRAAMPLTGADPFGEEFMELYTEWRTSGQPYHGLR